MAKVVLVGAVPPLMLKTEANPGGLPLEVFDGIRKGTYDNRAQFYRDLTLPFYGYNRAGAQVSEGVRESFWLQGMMGGLKGQLDCIREFSEVDYTEDLRQIDVPTLIVHGDDDQIVPIGAEARLNAKIVPDAVLKVYEGGAHGLPDHPPGRVQRRSPRLRAGRAGCRGAGTEEPRGCVKRISPAPAASASTCGRGRPRGRPAPSSSSATA